MENSAEEMCSKLFELLELVKQRVGELAEEVKLTRVQLLALYSIERHGSLAMGHIADTLHCDASNVTGIVDRLVAQGLVVRQPATHDRRVKTLLLTESGKHIMKDLKDKLPSRIGCDRLSAPARSQFCELIDTLLTAE